MIFKSIFPPVQTPQIGIFEYFTPYLDKNPDKILLIDGKSTDYLTYRQVKNTIQRIASGLIKRGFNKGDIFAIYTHNCIEYVLCIFAVHALGGVVSLINPNSTADELMPKLEDFDRRNLFILSNKANIDNVNLTTQKLGKFKGYFVLENEIVHGFEPLSQLLNDTSNRFTNPVTVDVNDTALILYSSGTTSKPKGVMLSHANFVSSLHTRLSQSETLVKSGVLLTTLAVLPFFHIIGVLINIMLPILYGSTIVILPRFQPQHFFNAIQKYKITMIMLVPSLVYFLAKSPLVEAFDLSSLKLIGCGGAPLNWDVVEQLEKKLNVQISQGYALTENTGFAFSRVTGLTSKGSVGHLAPGIEAKIIEEETGESVGVNRLGEIYIKGPNTMKGYLNNPEDTINTVDTEGWLHTGDIGYFDQNNSLFIVDRSKELIKYKAFQVAPAELEAILINHPGVQDCAVTSVPDFEAGELPKAFVVKRYPNLTEKELVDYVNAKVAQHMRLRGGVEFIAVIPKTDTGKILRRQLKKEAAASIKAKL